MSNLNMQNMIVPEMNQPQTPPPPSLNLNNPSSGGSGNNSRRFWVKVILAVVFVLVIAILIIGYVVVGLGKTALGEKMQDNLWEKLVVQSPDDIADFDMSITYTDTGTFKFTPSEIASTLNGESSDSESNQELDRTFGFSWTDLVLGFSSDTYANLADKNSMKLDTSNIWTAKNNNIDYQASLGVKLTDTQLFTKYTLSENVIAVIERARETGYSNSFTLKDKWILNEDAEAIKEANEVFKDLFPSDSETTPTTNSEGLTPEQELLLQNRLFKIKALVGASLIDKKPVLHYQVELDKEKLKTVIMESFKMANAEYPDEGAEKILSTITDAVLAKVNTSGYDIWVGVSDNKIYKAQITMNAVSASKAGNYFVNELKNPTSDLRKFIEGDSGSASSPGSTLENNNDQKRVADMRQLSSALELYFNDNNTYPPAMNGKPVGLEGTYIGALPVSPEPPDGACDPYYNEYWYTTAEAEGVFQNPQGALVQKFSNYKYTFCLGNSVNGLPAGNNEVTAAGFTQQVSTNQPEPVPTEPDLNEDAYEKQLTDLIVKTINDLTFDATLQINFEARSYGEVKTIEAPTDYITREEADKLLYGEMEELYQQ